MTWEYQTIKLELETGWTGLKLDPVKLGIILNKKGVDGWELASTIDIQNIGTTSEVFLVFKRPQQ